MFVRVCLPWCCYVAHRSQLADAQKQLEEESSKRNDFEILTDKLRQDVGSKTAKIQEASSKRVKYEQALKIHKDAKDKLSKRVMDLEVGICWQQLPTKLPSYFICTKTKYKPNLTSCTCSFSHIEKECRMASGMV